METCEHSHIHSTFLFSFTYTSGYRPIDIACMQRWSMDEIKRGFGDGAYSFCREGAGGAKGYEKKEPTAPYFFEGTYVMQFL